MTLVQFIKLVAGHIKLLVGVAMTLSILIFLLTGDGPKQYTSDTVIYTGLASGYTIESGENAKVDYFSVNNAFDNLIKTIDARETREEVGVRLLAEHLMLEEPQKWVIGHEAYAHLQELVSDSLRNAVVVPNSIEGTMKNIYAVKADNGNNGICALLNTDSEPYSIEKISEAKFTRVASSDMIEGSYSANDPAICQQTLVILTEIFIRRHKAIKQGETDNVVNYFQARCDTIYDQLLRAENELRTFRESYRIINYYEQTKYISSKKEDLDEEYHKEHMAQAAAKASLLKIESKLSSKDTILLHSEEIIKQRNKLSELTSQLAFLETDEQKDPNKIAQIHKEIERTKDALKIDVDKLYQLSHSTEGIPLTQLLDQWLANAIIIDEAQARTAVLDKRKLEFEKTYEQFAPLGSKLKQLERKINVREQEYLEMIHSLNLSKLKQQSIQMSSNLRVIDAPYFPIEAEASKRMLLVIVGGVAGFILTLALVIAMEFLDNTIRDIERSEDTTGLTAISAFPLIPRKHNKKIDYPYIISRLIEKLRHHIKLGEGEERSATKLKSIVVFSARNTEGKTLIANLLANKLREVGDRVVVLTPALPEKEAESDKVAVNEMLLIDAHQDDQVYEVTPQFSNVEDVQSLAGTPVDPSTDYIIVELPPILSVDFPMKMVERALASVMLVRSNRRWTDADQAALETFCKSAQTDPVIFLNAMKLDFLENVIGEIPKKRSIVRRFIKRLAKMEFKAKSNVA